MVNMVKIGNMDIEIFSPDFEVTETIKEHVIKEMERIERLLTNTKNYPAPVRVELNAFNRRSGKMFRAEINLPLHGKLLRAEEETDNLHSAINEAADDLERQVKKYKAR